MPDLAGTIIGGKYRLVRLLGEGGMGAVYEAEHTVITRRVAIKILHPRFNEHPEVAERFLREAQTASSIGHRNIIEIHDFGREEDGRCFIVMQLLEGLSLSSFIATQGKTAPGLAVAITLEILAGLKTAHDKGIIHRDIKPDNVFLERNSETQMTAKILDFGISKILSAEPDNQSLTQTGAILGTPVYMSPEQARGVKELDGRADIWAVGTMLYKLLSGTTPYAGKSYNEILAKIVEAPIPPLSDLVPDCPPSAQYRHSIPGERPGRTLPGRRQLHRRSGRFADWGSFRQLIPNQL